MQITFTEDTLDSRDILKRLEELRDERKGLVEMLDELKESIAGWESSPPEERDDPEELDELHVALHSAEEELAIWDMDNEDELKMLESVEDECDACGNTWVHADHLTRYAQDSADDMGVKTDVWPYTCIDWEQAAEELATDFTTVEVNEQTYYIT